MNFGKFKENVKQLLLDKSDVYNEKYKDEILQEHNSKNNFPFYITFVLVLLKILHYVLGVLPIYYYSMFKKTLTNQFYDNNKSEFFVLDF